MRHLPQLAAPFDDDSVNVTGANQVGDVGVFALRILVSGGNDLFGAGAVFRGDPVLEVARNALQLVAFMADQGQSAPRRKRRALDLASKAFFREVETAVDSPMVTAYAQFLQEADFWLEDYVRFQAFRDSLGRRAWTTWPDGLRQCEQSACDRHARELAEQMTELRFRQFVFNCQWHELREYANERGILLFGDMPIYVHQESADVWAHQALFDLDSAGHPVTVTGVPPDYFSAEGQLWGNPQYNWQRMQDGGFQWWLQRFDSAARQFDIARIDHFRALEAYWEIQASATSAKEGKWVQAPGRELLQLVRKHYPDLCLVAENLGTISHEVEALRAEFDLPGMLILQFAFDGNPDNPYLSHRHQQRDIVYTGTHDNNTTLGWFESIDDSLRGKVYQYFNSPAEGMPWMGTFHSIGVKLLRRHAELANLRSDFTILDTDDEIRLCKQLIQAEALTTSAGRRGNSPT